MCGRWGGGEVNSDIDLPFVLFLPLQQAIALVDVVAIVPFSLSHRQLSFSLMMHQFWEPLVVAMACLLLMMRKNMMMTTTTTMWRRRWRGKMKMTMDNCVELEMSSSNQYLHAIHSFMVD